MVVDLHDHLRTILLRNLFKLFGTPVIVFDKGRSAKREFTRLENKRTLPLPHTVERYRHAFEKAGFPIEMIASPPYVEVKKASTEQLTEWLKINELEKNERWIGVAPFAKHLSKMWPLDNYAHVIEQFVEMGQ